ncbi:MAG: DUF5687 family protein [Bacteroidetes bacterium]|nr:DUF5687 family protein [Bacteroidota bacterium]MDA0873742.1 DUF5687 family protein [Bacteroidota bacterium]
MARNQFRVSMRQMQSQQGWFMRIVLAVMMAYSAFILLTLGFFSAQLWPGAEPVLIVNRSLLAAFISLFFIRFLFQRTPRMKIVPYLHLPVSRPRLVAFFQAASLLSIHNFYPLLFFLPFWMRYVVQEGSPAGHLMWIGAVLLLILASHFANLLLRGILRQRAGLFYIWMSLFITTAFVDEAAGLGMQQRLSEFLFSRILSGDFLGLFLLLCFTLFVVIASTISLSRSIREPEGSAEATAASRVRSFDVPAEWGLLGQLVRIELLLMWRNRRPRHYLFISLLFSTLYLVFMLSAGGTFGGSAFAAFLGLFASGGFALNYGQLMFGWDSTHYTAFVSRNVPFHRLVQAKAIVLQASCLFLFVASLPLFVWLRPDLVPLHFAFLFYNAGITVILILELATRNRQRVDIGRSGGFFNYEGFSARHWLWFIPTALPPVLFMQVMHETPRLGLTILATSGLIGLMTTRWWTRYFAAGLTARKHIMLEGFDSRAG